MLTALNERLEQVKEAQELQAKWKRRLSGLERERQNRLKEVAQWSQRLSDNQDQAARLTGLTWTNLFHTVLGRKEDLLNQEKREIVEARLKLDEAEASAADIAQDIRELKKKLYDLGNPDWDYQLILREKERLLREHPSPQGEKLFDLAEEKAVHRAYLKEIHEAVRAGEIARSALSKAEELLRSAKSWGTWDMLGGGLITTAIKHSRIDEAKSRIHQAQQKLLTFQQELKDVELHMDVRFETGGMLKFADFFFDGLIVDWIVQGRINQSLQQVQEHAQRVSGIMRRLETEERKESSRIAQLARQYTDLLEGA